MRPIYFLLAEGAYAIGRAISDICRTVRLATSRWHFPPDEDFPSDETDAGVRRRPLRPGGTDAAQARPEIEGSNFSLVP